MDNNEIKEAIYTVKCAIGLIDQLNTKVVHGMYVSAGLEHYSKLSKELRKVEKLLVEVQGDGNATRE